MKIASFNAQRFGLKKALDPGVLSTLIKVNVKAVGWTAASCLGHKDNKRLTEIFVCLRKKELKLCVRYENNFSPETENSNPLVFWRSCPDTI